MRTILKKILLFTLIGILTNCGQNKSPFYDAIIKSEKGHMRGIEIGETIEKVKTKEGEDFLRDQMPDYLHYDYEISMGNTYTVTYDFSESNELYEIESAVFLDEIESAGLLFDNFSNYFDRKYSIGRKEDDGYMTWHTKSSISNARVAVSMINDSEAYGYLTILIRDLDY